MGQIGCSKCSIGKSTSSPGASACTACKAGRYEDREGSANANCRGQCLPGYHCPAGSSTNRGQGSCPPLDTDVSEWSSWYCAAGVAVKAPLGTLTLPTESSPDRRESYRECPIGKYCEKGVEMPRLEFLTPPNCQGPYPRVHPLMIQENPPVGTQLGWSNDDSFSVKVHGYDSQNHIIKYSFAKCPSGCSKNRPAEGSTCPGTGEFSMKSIPNDKAKVAVAKALDSDACASTFAMTVRAEVYHKSAASTAIGWAECVVSVQVQDANERPIIVKSSSDARRIVEEGAMPGTYVGTPLEAVDEEVSAGVQQLVWEMTSCKVTSTGVSIDPCPLRISACDGQMIVADVKHGIDFENVKSYTLEIFAKDDGSPSLSSPIVQTVVAVQGRNDPPEIQSPQSYQVVENPSDGQKLCTIVATDVDNKASDLEFRRVDTDTVDPFDVARNGDVIFRRVRKGKSHELDFESPTVSYNLEVMVNDGRVDARKSGFISLKVKDMNDAPVLKEDKLVQKCSGDANDAGRVYDNCLPLDENAAASVNLRAYVVDEDKKPSNGCCDPSPAKAYVLSGPSNGRDSCFAKYGQKIAVDARGMLTVGQGVLNYEDDRGCSMKLTIKDKQGATSSSDIRVLVQDKNDAPSSPRLKSTCIVKESASRGNLLTGIGCSLESSDEDGDKITYHESDGNQKSAVFDVEENGAIRLIADLDFEQSAVHVVPVYAKDTGGMKSTPSQITIKIADVNEPPIFDATQCHERKPPRFVEENHKGEFSAQVPVLATDPDTNAANAQWRRIQYSIPDGTENSAKFHVHADTGVVSTREELNYEQFQAVDKSFQSRGGFDVTVRATDLSGGKGGLWSDCTFFVRLKDVNEPPSIVPLPGTPELGSSVDTSAGGSQPEKEAPFLLALPAVNGDDVGPSLTATDPDSSMDDVAVCVKARNENGNLVTPNDWNIFDIDEASCQIVVKKKDDLSTGAVYALPVRAKDQGGPDKDNAIPLYSSPHKVIYIRAKDGLNKPVFQLTDPVDGSSPALFSHQERVGTSEISRLVAGSEGKLYAACTDDNVPSRSGGKTGKCSDDPDNVRRCATKYNTQDACNGASIPGPTACIWDVTLPGANKCTCRDQSLRYEVVTKATVPRKAKALRDPFEIDAVSGALSLVEGAVLDYESLLVIDEEIKCGFGKFSVYVDVPGNKATASEKYDYPIAGVSRCYNNDRKKSENAKDRFGYLGAAYLCAETGARLPTREELQDAFDTSTAFRPTELADYCDYTMTMHSGLGRNIPKTCNTPVATKNPAEDRSATGMNVWTYGAKVAVIPDGKSGRTKVEFAPQGTTSRRDLLPVMCYLGKDHNKPERGYSVKVRCRDTGDKTIDEGNGAVAYRQSQKDDKYVFVAITDQPEAPFFQKDSAESDDGELVVSEFSIAESAKDGVDTEGGSLSVTDNDVNVLSAAKYKAATNDNCRDFSNPLQNADAPPCLLQEMQFAVNAPNSVPFTFTKQKNLKNYAEATLTASLKNGAFLDFETQSNYTFIAKVTDKAEGGLESLTKVIVSITDVNEPPMWHRDTVSEFYVPEDTKPGDDFNSDLYAWDPDADDSGGVSFAIREDTVNPHPFAVEVYEDAPFDAATKVSRARLILRKNEEDSQEEDVRGATGLDYETTQSYTLVLTVTDNKGEVAEKQVTVFVGNVNDLSITAITVVDGSSEKLLNTPGNQLVRLEGTNMGIKTLDKSMRGVFEVSYSRCDTCETFSVPSSSITFNGTSNVAFTCTTSPGFGTNLRWTVRVLEHGTGKVLGRATTSASIVTAYAAPKITDIVTNGDFSTRGGDIVTLKGKNMGPLSAEIYAVYGFLDARGGLCAQNCRVTRDHVEVTCTTVPGVGNAHRWRMSTEDRSGPDEYGMLSESVTTYADPEIEDVFPRVLSTWGDTVVTVRGTNFGPRENPGGTQACNPGYTSPELGNTQGDNVLDVGLIVTGLRRGTTPFASDDRNGADIPRSYSYYSIVYDNGIEGKDKLAFGTAECEVTRDHDTLKCNTRPGVGMNFGWLLTVASQDSPRWIAKSSLTRYKTPMLTGIRGAAFDMSTEGGEEFYLEGNFFGPATSPSTSNEEGFQSNVLVEYGRDGFHWFKTPQCIVVISQVALLCRTQPGAGHSFSYRVTIANQTSVIEPGLGDFMGSYAAPVLFSLRPATNVIDSNRAAGLPLLVLRTNGSQTMVIRGENFGPAIMSDGRNAWNRVTAVYGDDPVRRAVADGGRQFLANECRVVEAHSVIECLTSEGAGFSHIWNLTVSGQLNRMPSSSYGVPRIDSIVWPDLVEKNKCWSPALCIDTFGQPISVPGATMSERACKGYTGNLFIPSVPAKCLEPGGTASTIADASKHEDICMGLTGNTYTPGTPSSCTDKYTDRPSNLTGSSFDEHKCKGMTGYTFTPESNASCTTPQGTESIIPNAADDANTCRGLTGNIYTPSRAASCTTKDGDASTSVNATNSKTACETAQGDNIFAPWKAASCSNNGNASSRESCEGLDNGNQYTPPSVQACEGGGDSSSIIACEGIDNGNIFVAESAASCTNGGNANSKVLCEGTSNGNIFTPAEPQQCTNGGNATNRLACEGADNGNVFTPPQEIPCGLETNRPGTDGSDVFTVHGINFGPPGTRASQSVAPMTAFLEKVTYGSSVNNSYDVTDLCQVMNFTRIRCKTIPGTGTNLGLTVQVRGQTNIPRDHSQISYARPVIVNISDSNKTNADPDEYRFVVTAIHGGLADTGATQTLLFNKHEDEFGRPTSDAYELVPSGRGATARRGPFEVFQFDLPELVDNMRGANISVRLKVISPGGENVQISEPKYWSYLKPVIKRIHVREGPTPDTKLVIIVGANFGAAGELELFKKEAPAIVEVQVLTNTTVWKNVTKTKTLTETVTRRVEVPVRIKTNYTETYPACLDGQQNECWCKMLRCPDNFYRVGNGSTCAHMSEPSCDLGYCANSSKPNMTKCEEKTPDEPVMVDSTDTRSITETVSKEVQYDIPMLVNATVTVAKNLSTPGDDGSKPFVILSPMQVSRTAMGHYLVCYRPLISTDLDEHNGPPNCAYHKGAQGHNGSLVPMRHSLAKPGYTHEQITMVYRGNSGELRVNRGYQTSERAAFDGLTPAILNVESAECLKGNGPEWCKAAEQNANWPLGATNVGLLPTRGGVIKVTCKYCGNTQSITVVIDMPLSLGHRGDKSFKNYPYMSPVDAAENVRDEKTAILGKGCYESRPLPGSGDKPRIRCPCYRRADNDDWLFDETSAEGIKRLRNDPAFEWLDHEEISAKEDSTGGNVSSASVQEHRKARFECYAPAGVGSAEDTHLILVSGKQESEPYHIGFVTPKIESTKVVGLWRDPVFESSPRNNDKLFAAKSLLASPEVECNDEGLLCSNTDGSTAIEITGSNLGDLASGTTWCVLESKYDDKRTERWQPQSISNDGQQDKAVCVVPTFKKFTKLGGALLGSERRFFHLDVGGQTTKKSRQPTVRYLPPIVTKVIQPDEMPSMGNVEIIIEGYNFDLTAETFEINFRQPVGREKVIGCKNVTVVRCNTSPCSQSKGGPEPKPSPDNGPAHRATCMLEAGAGKALALAMRVSDQCHAGRSKSKKIPDELQKAEVISTVQCHIGQKRFEIDYDPPVVGIVEYGTSMSTLGNGVIMISCDFGPNAVRKTCNFGTSSDGLSSCAIQILALSESDKRKINEREIDLPMIPCLDDCLEVEEPSLNFGDDRLRQRRQLLEEKVSPSSQNEPYTAPSMKSDSEVFEGQVLSRNHTHIIFKAPEVTGIGNLVDMSIVAVIEMQSSDPSKKAVLTYEAPVIDSLTFPWSNVMSQGRVDTRPEAEAHRIPASGCAEWDLDLPRRAEKRICLTPATIRVDGRNFARNLPWAEQVFVSPEKDWQPKADTSQAAKLPIVEVTDGTNVLTGTTARFHSHSRIDIELPSGMGDATLTVFQMRKRLKGVGSAVDCKEKCNGQEKAWCNYHAYRQIRDEMICDLGRAASAEFTYSKPTIRSTKWSPDIGTGGSGNMFDGAASSNNKLFLFGEHLGETEPPEGTMSINISGIPCDEPMWHPHLAASSPPGSPYITCSPRPARVGVKQLSVSVALQIVEINKLEDGSRFESRCFPNFYGLEDEYCVECWHHYDSTGNKIYAANCTGQWDDVAMGTVEPRAKPGYDLLPPPACQRGECGEMPEFAPNIELSQLGENRVPENCMAAIEPEDEGFGVLRVPEECEGASLAVGEVCDSLRLNANLTLEGVNAWRLATPSEENAGLDLLELTSTRRVCPYIMPCEPVEACLQQQWTVGSTKQFIIDVRPPDLYANESQPLSENNTTNASIYLNDGPYTGFSECAEGYVSYYRSWLGTDKEMENNPSPEDDLPCPSGSIKLKYAQGAFTGLPTEFGPRPGPTHPWDSIPHVNAQGDEDGCNERRFCEDKALFSGDSRANREYSGNFAKDNTVVAPEWSAGRCFSPRCGECNPKSHFRLDGVCEPCPKCAWCLPVLLVCGAIMCGCGFYVFQRVGASPAVLNIGIDYFQVLSTFAKSKVRWPYEILYLLKLMNWINFDIDMTAPECFARAFLTFERKWWIKVSIPFSGVIVCFCCIIVLRMFGCADGRPAKRNAAGQVTICSYLGCMGAPRKRDASSAASALNNASKSAEQIARDKKRAAKEKRKHRKGDRNVPLKTQLIEMFITIICKFPASCIILDLFE